MSLAPHIVLQQRQRLALTPSMRSALAILRMPTDQLCDEIIREAADNPFLDLTYAPRGKAHDIALATTAAVPGLSVSLVRQIDLQRLTPAVRDAAVFLVGQLRQDGYLDVTLPDLAADAGMNLTELESGLVALQRCEPTGVGARDLAECLALQLTDMGYASDLSQAVVRQLENFAEDRIARIMHSLGLSRAEVTDIARDIRSLTPTPVSIEDEVIMPRIPELLAERKGDGTLGIALNPDALPRLALTDLGGGLRDSPQMKLCLIQARSLTRGLAARSLTLLRIGRHIVDGQAGFFRNSTPTIVPESQKAAALSMNMHPSTLGRALAGKSLSFAGKTHALAQFFSHAVPSADGAISAFDIQARIRRRIKAEDCHSPLSDDAICADLNNEGVDIARRTVAKYRKCMRIPSSYNRRLRNSSDAVASQAKQK